MIKTTNTTQNVPDLFFFCFLGRGRWVQSRFVCHFVLLPICIYWHDFLLKWFTFVCDVVTIIFSRYIDLNIDGIVQQGSSNSIFCWIYSFITLDRFFSCCGPIKYIVGWGNIVPCKYHITVFKLRRYFQWFTFKKNIYC